MNQVPVRKDESSILRASRFSRLYDANVEFQDIANLGQLGEERPPTYSEALNLYSQATGYSASTISAISRVSYKTSLIGHILNPSESSIHNSRHPRISARFFFNIGRFYGAQNLDDLRIPVVFYDRHTGLLVLRSRSEIYRNDQFGNRTDYTLDWAKSSEKLVDQAIRYLSMQGEGHPKSNWIAGYVSNILISRFRQLQEGNKRKFKRKKRGAEGRLRFNPGGRIDYFLKDEHLTITFGRKKKEYDEFELNPRTINRKGTHIARLMKVAEECLGLVPVYLVQPMNREELEANRDEIRKHIELLRKPLYEEGDSLEEKVLTA